MSRPRARSTLRTCSLSRPRRNGQLPKPTLATVFEVVAAGKVYRVTGAALQRWIVEKRSSWKRPKGGQKLSGEQWVTVVNQVPFSDQNSVLRIREISGNLAHPQSLRRLCNPCDFHLPYRQVDEKQHNEPLQTSASPHFYREEIRAYNHLPMPAVAVGSILRGGRPIPRVCAKTILHKMVLPRLSVSHRPSRFRSCGDF